MKTTLTLLCSVALLCGCRTPEQTDTLTGLAVQTAACELAVNKPVSATWLRAAGNVFKIYGQSTIPTPATLQEALAAIPLGNLTAGERALIVQAAIAAYQLAYQDATPERALRIQHVLTVVGTALTAGADCAPSTKLVAQPTSKDTAKVVQSICNALNKVR